MRTHVIKQGFINILFLYTGSFIGFFNTILKARALQPEEIGVIAVITSISTMIGYIISFGVPNGLRKYYYRFSKDVKTKTGFIYFCLFSPVLNFFVISAVFFLFRNYTLGLYDNKLLVEYFDYIYWFFLGNHLVTVFQYLFESEYMSVIANIYYDFIWRILHLVFLLIMLHFSFGFFYYFMFTLLSLGSRVLIYVFFFVKKIGICSRPSFSFLNKDFVPEFYRFTFLNFFSGMTGIVTETIDKLMIGAMLALADAGIYTIVAQLTVFIRIIAYAFNRIAHPLVAEYWEKGEKEKIKELYKNNSAMQLLLGSFVFVIMVSFPSQILSVAGKEYSQWGLLMAFLAFGYLFDITTGGTSSAIISYSGYYHYDLVSRVFQIMITVALNLAFIPRWGLNGAAFASALSLVFYNLLKIAVIWKKSAMHPFGKNTVKIVLLASLMVLLAGRFNTYFYTDSIFVVFAYAVLFLAVYVFAGIFIFRIDVIAVYAEKIFKKNP